MGMQLLQSYSADIEYGASSAHLAKIGRRITLSSCRLKTAAIEPYHLS